MFTMSGLKFFQSAGKLHSESFKSQIVFGENAPKTTSNGAWSFPSESTKF